jgi:DNA polymerase-3 subunit delta'
VDAAVISFDDIFGQAHAIDWLKRAYSADRLPHGLIIAGPVGVGKATTARALAALMLCEKPVGLKACGKCASCVAFEAGNHPDYHVITKELIRYHDKTGKSKGIDLSINVVRPELIEPASRKAVMGRAKVFVVEQAELMNPQAQNALLKTLEEPAGRTAIILLTDQPGALLPTINSRCQVVRFGALAPDVVRRVLEHQKIDSKLAARAAELSEGSIGLALKWIDDGVVEASEDMISQIDAALNGTPPSELPGWMKKAAEAYAEKQLERDPLASKDQAMREGLNLYLMLAANRMRAALHADVDPDALERACAAIDFVARAELYLDANVNTALVLQQLSIALSN